MMFTPAFVLKGQSAAPSLKVFFSTKGKSSNLTYSNSSGNHSRPYELKSTTQYNSAKTGSWEQDVVGLRLLNDTHIRASF